MRTEPYPVPPSRVWSFIMLCTYGVLGLAGALVLVLLVVLPQSPEGTVVLSLWGGLTAPASLACVYGVARSRYRFEWIGTWFLVMGTSIYLVVTAFGLVGSPSLLQSLPSVLVLAYAVGMTLGRAVQLSLIDMQARRRVLIERAIRGGVRQ